MGDFLDDDDPISDLSDWTSGFLSDFGEALTLIFFGIVVILILLAIIGHEF